MNKRLWYINAFLAVVLTLCCVYGVYNLPEYPSGAKFQDNTRSGRNATVDGDESESLTVVSARGFSNWLDPPPSYGSVTITIEPPEAVEAGAGWRVGGSEWLNSQEQVDKVTPGKKTVTFKSIKGWVSPSVSVEVVKDQLSEAIATYKLPPQGQVRVNIEPEAVLALGPQWQLDGEWLDHGQLSPKTAVGNYRLTFKAVEGWDSPTLSVTVENEKITDLTAEYKLIRYGYIEVKLPEQIQPVGAQWKIDNGQWLSFKGELQKVRLGNYKVSFKNVEDWISPEPITLDIQEEKTYTVEKSYTRIPYSQLKVSILPENEPRISTAQWKLNDRSWRDSDEVENKVPMGRHSITFKAVDGWQTPVKTEIEVSEEVTYLLFGQYERIRPAGPSFTIRSVIEVGGGNGIAFTTPTTGYLVGEEIDGFMLTRIEYGKVFLEKEGFEYELEVIEKAPPQQPVIQAQPTQPNLRTRTQPQTGQPQPTREQLLEMQQQRQAQFQQQQLEMRGPGPGGRGNLGVGGRGGR